jgi:hypothetical protein
MFIGLLISAHLGFVGTYNSIHPHVGVYLNKHLSIGAYYNSEEKISAYLAYRAELSKRSNIEIGLVTGYSDYEVVPMIKFNYNHVFITPSFESIDDQISPGVVVGLEWRY